MHMKRNWKPRNIHLSNTLFHVACRNKDVKFGSTFDIGAYEIKRPKRVYLCTALRHMSKWRFTYTD